MKKLPSFAGVYSYQFHAHYREPTGVYGYEYPAQEGCTLGKEKCFKNMVSEGYLMGDICRMWWGPQDLLHSKEI